MAVVEGLYRFPVKSMRGEALAEAELGASGVVGDRAYALLDETDGRIASAKSPRKWGGLLGFRATFVDEPQPDADPPPVAVEFPDGTVVRSDDPDVHALLSKALGRPVRLIASAGAETAGLQFEEVWPDIEGLAPEEFVASTAVGREEGSGEVLSAIPAGMFAPPGTFFDLSVIHLLTTATLDALRAQAPDATFDVRRYRPNVLLAVDAGDDGFVENAWVGRSVALGGDGAALSVSLPTMRCVMTTLPQEDLPRDRGTLRAIAGHNRVEIAGFGTWACAGAYCGVTSGGRVRVGDAYSIE
jgi:uncharacterized protein YcbX